MDDKKKSLQANNPSSKDLNEVSYQLPEDSLKHVYECIHRAGEIISFSNQQGWSKEQLLNALNVIQSLEHFS